MNLTSKMMVVVALLGTFGAIETAAAAGDPTSGRLAQREYKKCEKFSKRVLNAGLAQANGNRAKIDSAYRHYYGNIARCRARFL